MRNFKSLETNLNRIANNVRRNINLRIDDYANNISNEVRLATPVDTGKARRGWENIRVPGGRVVKNEVNYIVYLNQGHSQQAPERFVERSVQRVKVRMQSRGTQILDDVYIPINVSSS